MKKILFILIIVLSFAATTLLANTNELLDIPQDQKELTTSITQYVVDNASLLTDEEVLKLEAKSIEIKQKYNFDTIILTVDDIGNNMPRQYSSDFFHNNNYHEDAIIFLISMGERDWDISLFGNGRSVFTDEYGLDYIVEKVIPHLSDGDYNKSFSNFLYYADDFLLEAESNTPYSLESKIIPKNKIMIIVAIVALVIAISVIVFMAHGMSTKKSKNFAHEYVKRESINMTERTDMFLYRTVIKTARPKRSSSSGGGGSRSGGRSGKF